MKLLIATGETASDLDEVPTGARLLIDSASEILVMVPELPTRVAWLASDTDKSREVADERLQTVLSQVGDDGQTVEGTVGTDDPLVAFDDAIAEFRPDHLLIALRSAGSSGWQERGLVEQVVERFGLPVTVFRIAESG
jgi:hypothetical protein